MQFAQYLPAGLLVTGAALSMIFSTPEPTPLPRPLTETIPAQFIGMTGVDVPIDPEETAKSGATEYLNRAFDVGAETGPMLMYIGYHATQQGDNRMHSPTLCLPGSGWTPVSSELVPITVGQTQHMVNRYVLQKGGYHILVYYWFQGRGRVTAGEAELKIQTLIDALMTGRDEEALARIVVPLPKESLDGPVGNTSLPADTLATRFAMELIPALEKALPPAP
jgi:EpsI family protein